MRLEAIGKNIELPIFCAIVERFFTDQNYQSSRHPIKGGYYVVGRPLSPKDKRPKAVVIVEGQPNKFTIEIMPVHPDSVSPGMRIGASFIGTIAGLEIRKAAEKQNQFIAFEKLFWDFVRKSIAEFSKI